MAKNRTCLTAAAVVLAFAGCSGPDQVSGLPDQPTSARPPEPANSTTIPAPRPAIDNPVSAAEAWLTAYRSIRWTDPHPSAWIDRVRPIVSDRLFAEYANYRDGAIGADWTTFVQRRCTSTVLDAEAVIPAENPGTDTATPVIVSGNVTTTCISGQPATPIESVAATVLVLRSADGQWRVDEKIY